MNTRQLATLSSCAIATIIGAATLTQLPLIIEVAIALIKNLAEHLQTYTPNRPIADVALYLLQSAIISVYLTMFLIVGVRAALLEQIPIAEVLARKLTPNNSPEILDLAMGIKLAEASRYSTTANALCFTLITIGLADAMLGNTKETTQTWMMIFGIIAIRLSPVVISLCFYLKSAKRLIKQINQDNRLTLNARYIKQNLVGCGKNTMLFKKHKKYQVLTQTGAMVNVSEEVKELGMERVIEIYDNYGQK